MIVARRKFTCGFRSRFHVVVSSQGFRFLFHTVVSLQGLFFDACSAANLVCSCECTPVCFVVSPQRKVVRSLDLPGCAHRQVRSSLEQTYLLKCITCHGEIRQRKIRRLLEPLNRCTQGCSSAAFLNATRIRTDERVLLETEQADLHAKNVLYHASCLTLSRPGGPLYAPLT